METLITVQFPVPNSDIDEIEEILSAHNIFVSAFDYDTENPYSVLLYHQQRLMHETQTFLLPDRQIVSYLKTLFTSGSIPDTERCLIGAIMAFARLAGIIFEPRMAMYEYADLNGNDAAWADLAIFRHADNTSTKLFVDLALGRIGSIPQGALYTPSSPLPPKPEKFLSPGIWKFDFCYPFILKIALLERTSVSQLQKMLDFENWMTNEYFHSPSGALFGNLFLSPSRLKKMIKHLNSPQRDLRVRGVRNAAWDTTFITDWCDHAHKQFETNQIWLGISNDKAVLKTASRLLSTDNFSGIGATQKLLNIFREDWGDSTAAIIHKKYRESEARCGDANRPANKHLPISHWQQLTRELEAQI